MDPNALAGMVFTLVFTGLIGGFFLLHPLAKRLGALMEAKMEEKGSAASDEDVRLLAESVRSLESELRSLKERQEFTENILTARTRQSLPGEPPAR